MTLWVARTLAFVGFVDATYLTATHYSGGSLACGPEGGCDLVTTSAYSEIGGLPIAVIGVAYYVVVNAIVWASPAQWTRGRAGALLLITGAAVAISGGLVYLQAAVIHAWCRYCLISAVVSVALLTTAVRLYRTVNDGAASKG